MAAAPDDEPRGYGARRGWRAPKGGGAPRPPRAKARKDQGARASGSPSADPVDLAASESLAGPLAGLLGLDDQGAQRLAADELPAPGSPQAVTEGFRAAGRMLAAARQTEEDARAAARAAAELRERDAKAARTQIERAQERASRQQTKATHEQGERQRLAGELERAHARLSQLIAERDHLQEQARAVSNPTDSGVADGRSSAQVAGLVVRVETLEAQLEERALLLEQLTEEREAAEAEAERLLTSARHLRRLAVEAGATDVDLVDREDEAPLRAAELPEVRTVLEAVELAADHAQHLIYTERAFESARTAPYGEPQKLLRDLVALDRVAAAWAVTGGIGRPIRDVALEQQLDWADDVSNAARGQNAREYLFTHHGRTLWAGPHVRVATGRGLQRTCRVYLALVKGTEPDLAGLPRGIYVGPVGRHLSDSTSG